MKTLHRPQKPTFIELFFDLVFVFAIILTSHTLAARFDLSEVLGLCLMVVMLWRLWWINTWSLLIAHPERLPVQLYLFFVMGVTLVLVSLIPNLFLKADILGDTRLVAGMYMMLQLAHVLFITLAARRHKSIKNLLNLWLWLIPSLFFWTLGAFAHPLVQPYYVLTALLIECLGAFLCFPVPHLGRFRLGERFQALPLMTERVGTFVLIALGEIILSAGLSLQKTSLATPHIIALLLGLCLAALLWWVYFENGHAMSEQVGKRGAEKERIIRIALQFPQILVFLGIMWMAAGVQGLVAYPLSAPNIQEQFTLGGGMIAFLLGSISFKHALTTPHTQFVKILPELLGVFAMSLLIALAPLFQKNLLFATTVGVVLVLVVALEEWLNHEKRRHKTK